MPKVDIEFSIVRRTETSETGTIEVNVPQSVLDDDDLTTWLDEKYTTDVAFAKQVDQAAEVDDECEDVDWDSADQL